MTTRRFGSQPRLALPDLRPQLAQGRALLARLGHGLRMALASVLWAFLLIAGVAIVLWGIGMIFPPAAVIGAGLALLATVTFDPAKRGRLQWPR